MPEHLRMPKNGQILTKPGRKGDSNRLKFIKTWGKRDETRERKRHINIDIFGRDCPVGGGGSLPVGRPAVKDLCAI